MRLPRDGEEPLEVGNAKVVIDHLADHGELDRDVCVAAAAAVGESLYEINVVVRVGLGRLSVVHVLAQQVERNEQAIGEETIDDREGFVERLAGYKPTGKNEGQLHTQSGRGRALLREAVQNYGLAGFASIEALLNTLGSHSRSLTAKAQQSS